MVVVKPHHPLISFFSLSYLFYFFLINSQVIIILSPNFSLHLPFHLPTTNIYQSSSISISSFIFSFSYSHLLIINLQFFLQFYAEFSYTKWLSLSQFLIFFHFLVDCFSCISTLDRLIFVFFRTLL